jgi:hypothetical protein
MAEINEINMQMNMQMNYRPESQPGVGPKGDAVQLVNGVQAGEINRQEFISLNLYANETLDMRAQLMKDGLTQEERVMLIDRENAYQTMYSEYASGEFAPEAPEGSSKAGELGKIFDGMKEGSISEEEAVGLLKKEMGVEGSHGPHHGRKPRGKGRPPKSKVEETAESTTATTTTASEEEALMATLTGTSEGDALLTATSADNTAANAAAEALTSAGDEAFLAAYNQETSTMVETWDSILSGSASQDSILDLMNG